MNRFSKLIWTLAVAAFVLLPVLIAFASDPRAEVAVSIARVNVARQKQIPLPSDFMVANLQYENAELTSEVNHLRDEAVNARANLNAYKRQLDLVIGEGDVRKHDAATDGNASDPSAVQPDADWTRPPVLSLAKPVGTAPSAKHEVLVATAGWCGPCHSQKNRNGDGNDDISYRYVDIEHPPVDLPAGWLAAVNHRMQELARNGGSNIPLTTWFDSRGMLQWIHDPSITSERLLAIIERPRNFPPARKPISAVSASGAMGSVNARAQIEYALSFFNAHVHGPVVVTWDSNRNGGKGANDGFNILHAKSADWTCDRIYGTFGQFSIRCEAGIEISGSLYQQLDITYKSVGDKIEILTSFAVDKASLAPGDTKASAVGAQPVGIDPATALTIFSVLKGIWSLCHPELDIQLPGRIQATISVKDEAFLVDFDGPPRIRAKMLWEWMLEMDWVTASTTKAHVEFVPQKDYWIQIRSRELAITGDAVGQAPTIEQEIDAAIDGQQQGYASPAQDLRHEWASKYRTAREHKLAEQPTCEACGSSEHLETHHEVSISRILEEHLDPSLIADEANLCVLCRDHHLQIGHDFDGPGGPLKPNWSESNPNVRRDAAKALKAIQSKTMVAP